MIASERSLPSAHLQPQTQQQRKRQSVVKLGKFKNGRHPIRPVKVYVLDPRTLQQRLEAYVGQKNKREAEAAAAEKAKEQAESESKNEIEIETEEHLCSKTTSTVTSSSTSSQSVKYSQSGINSSNSNPATKALPPPPPNLIQLKAAVPSPPPIQKDPAHIENGVPVPQFVTTTTSAFSLPHIPSMVTNGVSLLQTPITQSLVQTSNGGILPGIISAVPPSTNVITNGANSLSVTRSTTSNTSPRPKKKKAKAKTKQARKRKQEYDEIDYLRKETTTRSGRVSRAASQPHSPFTGSSRVPSPSSNKKKRQKEKKFEAETELSNIKVVGFRCETCFETYTNQDKLNIHLEECERRNRSSSLSSHAENGPPKVPQRPQLLATSTNDLHQGMVHQVPLSSQPQQGLSLSSNVAFTTATIPATTCSMSAVNSVVNALVPAITTVPETNSVGTLVSNSCKLSVNSIESSSTGLLSTFKTSAPPQPFLTPPTSTQQQQLQQTELSSTILTDKHYHEENKSSEKCNNLNVKPSVDGGRSVSLVPTNAADEPEPVTTDLFSRNNNISMMSNVDLVPSSFTIPNSPSSQCQSPGFSDNNNHFNNLVTEVGSTTPERVVCHSPKDPMLLRSRSPFPPPILLETSLNSVSVSNLSIPEESLCRGELFMDLGESIMETNLVSRMSPYCNVESAGEPLFASSPIKMSCELDNLGEEGAAVVDSDLELEPEDPKRTSSSAPPQIIAPILTTEDANDGEIFQSAANYARSFLSPSLVTIHHQQQQLNGAQQNIGAQQNDKTTISGTLSGSVSLTDFPKTPLSLSYLESDISMDNSEIADQTMNSQSAPSPNKRGSVWQFVKEQINFCGISQACGEISEMAEKLSRIARDQFIPIREDEIERMGSSAPIVHVDTPFFSHLLDLPFGTYIFKEDAGKRRKVAPPPPITSSELSFTGGVEDVEKFLPPNIDLIALPHLTNLDLI